MSLGRRIDFPRGNPLGRRDVVAGSTSPEGTLWGDVMWWRNRLARGDPLGRRDVVAESTRQRGPPLGNLAKAEGQPQRGPLRGSTLTLSSARGTGRWTC